MSKKMLDIMLETFSTMPLESKNISKNPCKGIKPCSANEDCMTWVKGCRLKSVNVRQVNHMKRSIKKLEDILKKLPQDQDKKQLVDKIRELKQKIEFPEQTVQKGQVPTVQKGQVPTVQKGQVPTVQKGQVPTVQSPQEINALKAQMAAVKADYNILKGNSQKVQLKRSILEKEYQELQGLHQASLAELQQINRNLEKENQALNERIVDMEDRINNYENQIQFLNETNTNYQKNLRQASLEYVELQNQIKFLDEEYQRINNRLTDCQKPPKQQQTQITPKQNRKQQQIRSKQSVQLKRQLENIQNDYADLDNQLYEKKNIIEQLKASVQKNKLEIKRINEIREEDNVAYNDLIEENINLKQNLVKFDRLKYLMGRRDTLTDSQLEEFQNIMYSI